MQALLAEGRGLILVTAHVGCWQASLSALSFLKVPVHLLMQREEDTRKIFEDILKEGISQRVFKVENPALVAHNILMLGHMWGLKRWALGRYLNIDQFVRLQTDLLLSGILAS